MPEQIEIPPSVLFHSRTGLLINAPTTRPAAHCLPHETQCTMSNNPKIGESSSNAPDQSIDLHTIHIIEFLDGVLNLPLVCLDVHNKDQCVVLLNFLHGRFSVEGVNNDLVLIQSWGVEGGLAQILWRTRKGLGMWPAESGRSDCLLVHLWLCTLQSRLLSISSLLCCGSLGS